MRWPVNPLRGKTTDWRAVCGKSARTVRRGEGLNSISSSYPYPCMEPTRYDWVRLEIVQGYLELRRIGQLELIGHVFAMRGVASPFPNLSICHFQAKTSFLL